MMLGDQYLHRGGEVEAEHLWVNEWADTHAVAARPKTPTAVHTVSVVPHRPSEPPVADADTPQILPAADGADRFGALMPDQLMRDMAEIAFARDAMERDAGPACHGRRGAQGMRLGEAFRPALFTLMGRVAGLTKIAR